MSKIELKLQEIDWLYDLQQQNLWINQLHPLVKFLTSILFIGVVFSINKYHLEREILMAIYLVVGYSLAQLSVKEALWRVKLILPLVLAVGIFNPIFDCSQTFVLGGLVLSAGWISMLTMMLKGIYSVLAAYLLIATTSIEEICHALRLLHVPKEMVTVILLTYRYLLILGKEADRIMTAYSLRAPSQKGLNYKVWGSLVGQWMLRSFDRAERIYEAMVLRGFRGEFPEYQSYHAKRVGVLYLAAWAAVFVIIQWIPMTTLI